MFLDEPPLGSITDICDSCRREIIVGPESQRVLREHPDAVKGCMPCVLAARARDQRAAVIRRAKDWRMDD